MLTVENSTKFDWTKIPLVDCLRGNAMDTYYTSRIYIHLLEDIRNIGLEKLYDKLISPLTTLFSEVELDGMLIDEKELESLGNEMEAALKTLDDKLLSNTNLPENVNLKSGLDLIKILFSLKKSEDGSEWEVMDDGVGFGLYPPSRTSKGQPSTDTDTIKLLKEFIGEELVRRGLNNGT